MYDFLKIIKLKTTSFPGFSHEVAWMNAHLKLPKVPFGNNNGMSFLYRATSERAEDRLRRVSDSFAYLNPTAITREIDLFHNGGLSTYSFIERFHMTSRRPCWCPKTMKRRPYWCPEPILWGLNSFLMQTLSFVPINLHRCWPREWKHSIGLIISLPELVNMCKIPKNSYFQTRSGRLIIIHIREYINRPPLWRRSMPFGHLRI